MAGLHLLQQESRLILTVKILTGDVISNAMMEVANQTENDVMELWIVLMGLMRRTVGYANGQILPVLMAEEMSVSLTLNDVMESQTVPMDLMRTIVGVSSNINLYI